MFWKYVANLQKNTHAEVWFKWRCKATLLKLHFDMGVLLLICCIFSEHLFLRTLLCFENYFSLKKTCKKSVTPWKVLSFPLKNVMNTSYLQSLVKGDFYNRNAIWSFFFRSFKRNSYSNKSFWRGKFIRLSICNNHNFLSSFSADATHWCAPALMYLIKVNI